MELLSHLSGGFSVVFEPLNLALVIAGCALGLFIGVLPGLSSINGVAILLPMTFWLPSTSAVIFLAAIYYGAIYGSALGSIMLAIPGSSTVVAAKFDNRSLALTDTPDNALSALIITAVASFIGGIIAVMLLTLLVTPLSNAALTFAAPEEFALVMLVFATFVGLGGGDVAKTFFSIVAGLVMSTVGLDIVSGQTRLIFADIPGFFHGIPFLVLAIGIYGVGGMLSMLDTSKRLVQVAPAVSSVKPVMVALKPMKSVKVTNSAAITASMLVMLALGIPGSTTTAILVGGMVMGGLQPGPLLFVNEAEFVWSLIASFYLSNLLALLFIIGLVSVFMRALKIPFTLLAPMIFILCLIGVYAINQDMHDVWLMLGFGVMGYLLRKLDYPIAPALFAIVLGPLAETTMRQVLISSHGSPVIFFERPVFGTIMAITVVLFLLPMIKVFKKSLGYSTDDSSRST